MDTPTRPRIRARGTRPLLAAATLLLSACTPFQTGMPGQPLPPTSMPGPPAGSSGLDIARAAEALLGAPYRYGGAGPDTFDCSGLVSYVHGRLGYTTPRTAAQQFAAATPVRREELRAGDLVFFRLGGGAVSHVGVYIGGNEFVHAPQTGARVRIAKLDDEYYQSRYAGAGRFYAR